MHLSATSTSKQKNNHAWQESSEKQTRQTYSAWMPWVLTNASSICWKMNGWLQIFRSCMMVFMRIFAPPRPCRKHLISISSSTKKTTYLPGWLLLCTLRVVTHVFALFRSVGEQDTFALHVSVQKSLESGHVTLDDVLDLTIPHRNCQCSLFKCKSAVKFASKRTHGK